MSAGNIALAVTASSAYLGFLAYRKWNILKKRRQEPQRNPVRITVLDSYSVWNRMRIAFLETIYASGVMAIDFQWQQDLLEDPRIISLSIAVSKHEVYIYKFSEFSQIPEELEIVLKNTAFTKLGVGIVESAASLKAHSGIEIAGCIDLRYMAMKTPALRRKLIKIRSDLSLCSLLEAVLGEHVVSDEKMHGMDWTARELSSEQIYGMTERAVAIFKLTREICASNGLISRLVGVLRSDLWLQHYIYEELVVYTDIPFQLERITRLPLPVKSSAPSAPPRICVVCGVGSDLLKAHIVPEEYHCGFKEPLNDEVILCVGCDEKLSWCEDILRQQLETLLDAPVVDPEHPFIELEGLKEARHAAGLLLQRGDELSTERREDLEHSVLKRFPHVQKLEHDLLRYAATINYRFHKISFEYHGRVVCQKLSEQKLRLLERMWRENFVLQMEPAFLPPSFLPN